MRIPLLAAALTLSAALAAHADTYKILNLGSDANHFLYGIDDSGTVVLNQGALCTTVTCFVTYTDGVATGTSVNAPVLQYDNGTACAPAPTGYVVEHAVCNGSRVAWTGYPAGNINETGVFDGSDPLLDLLSTGGEGPLMMSGTGDVVWDDHFSEQIFEAIDVTTAVSVTPEPSSFALLGTGLLGLGGYVRRRQR